MWRSRNVRTHLRRATYFEHAQVNVCVVGRSCVLTQILRHEKLSHRQRLKESVCVCVLTQMVKDVSLRERRERERERREELACV
jgi:hypothetical protein